MDRKSILRIEGVHRAHRQGWLKRTPGFSLEANFEISSPSITALMGLNGAGKSSLFDLIAGHDTPTFGRIFCSGQDVHGVKRTERNKLVRYNRQTQMSRYRRSHLPPDFLLQPAQRSEPAIHLFDEPNQEEWMTRIFFNVAFNLRAKGNVVLFSMHPNRVKDIAVMRGICDRYIYVEKGQYNLFNSYRDFLAHPPAYQYLLPLLEGAEH